MTIKKPLLTALCFILLPISILPAQSPILEKYIQEGIRSNLQLQQEELNYERRVEDLELARALFMPQLGVNASYSLAEGGRKISLPVGTLLNQVYSTLNTLTKTNDFPSINDQSIQFLPNNFHDTKLRVIQPIFNPDIYFNYKAQKDLVSVQQAQKNAYENELKFNIASSYYQYLETEASLKILHQTRTILQELLKINQRLVSNEKATKDVVLTTDYELDKLDQQLAEAEKNNAVARSYFNFLLNRDLNANIEQDTVFINSVATKYDLQELKNAALDNRQELKQTRGGVAATSEFTSLNKASMALPKISVVGDAGYQGYYYKFNGDQRYWLVQFSLTWDIFKGGEKRARVQQARIDYQIAENRMEQLKKQIELQVIQAYHELEAAQRSFATSLSGVKSTERSFQIIRSKYTEGQAIMLEYLDAENKLTTARLTQVINTYELLRKEAALHRTIANL